MQRPLEHHTVIAHQVTVIRYEDDDGSVIDAASAPSADIIAIPPAAAAPLRYVAGSVQNVMCAP